MHRSFLPFFWVFLPTDFTAYSELGGWPSKRYVQVLTPRTCEHDHLVWKNTHCRCTWTCAHWLPLWAWPCWFLVWNIDCTSSPHGDYIFVTQFELPKSKGKVHCLPSPLTPRSGDLLDCVHSSYMCSFWGGSGFESWFCHLLAEDL